MAEDNNILDFYPDGEEDSCAEDSYVTLVDDEGNEVEMSVVDIVEHKGENYVILLPVENIESGDMQFAVIEDRIRRGDRRIHLCDRQRAGI